MVSGGENSGEGNAQTQGKVRRERTWVSEAEGGNQTKDDSWEVSLAPDPKPKKKPWSKKK